MSPRRNWDAPNPKCAPPPRTEGGGGSHSPAGKGLVGSPNSDDLRKILALCLYSVGRILLFLMIFHSSWNSSWICGEVPFARHRSFLSYTQHSSL